MDVYIYDSLASVTRIGLGYGSEKIGDNEETHDLVKLTLNK
jgi:hypothetical protein